MFQHLKVEISRIAVVKWLPSEEQHCLEGDSFLKACFDILRAAAVSAIEECNAELINFQILPLLLHHSPGSAQATSSGFPTRQTPTRHVQGKHLLL
jgi:hypothetical protein